MPRAAREMHIGCGVFFPWITGTVPRFDYLSDSVFFRPALNYANRGAINLAAANKYKVDILGGGMLPLKYLRGIYVRHLYICSKETS